MQPQPDRMLELTVKLNLAQAAHDKACDIFGSCQERNAGVGPAEQMVDTAGEIWVDVLREIAETPATSLEGILTKVRILAKDLDLGVTDYTDVIAEGAIRDIEALVRLQAS